MIVYSPLDGHTMSYQVPSNPKHCFLMTRLGKPVPETVNEIRDAVTRCCETYGYSVIDAQSKITGRDLLLKIWNLIASAPVSVGILHEDIPQGTQANIIYELGVAQALGKETVVVKSPGATIPSDLVRTEYISFDDKFVDNFNAFLTSVFDQAEFYETLADQLEKNPVLSLDYVRRAFLINGNAGLRQKAQRIVEAAGLEERAGDSVERIAASF